MSKRVCIATLHTGNTLTVFSHSFFKGRPTIVEDEGVIEWLKGHPNFTVKFKDVAEDEAKDKILSDTRQQLRKEGEYVAPVLDEVTSNPDEVAEEAVGPNITPKAPVRRGASRISK